MRRCTCCWNCALLLLVLIGRCSPLDAAEPPKDAQAAAEAKKDAPPKPSTVKVKKGPFRIEVSLDGVFEAQHMTEMVLRPQEWVGLTVLSAVEHGTVVRRGDLLLALDLEKIDRAIADLRAELEVTDLTMQQAEQSLHMLEASTPLDLAAGQRAAQAASEDLKLYVDVNRPLLLRTHDFSLTMAKETLEYQEEELRQLEKMYKADDLTEETERIVLRRARNAVERAKFMYERAKIEHDHALKYDVPRGDEKVKDSAQRAALQWERDKIAIPVALKKQRLDLEKLKVQRARSAERLKNIQADREMMTVKAPVDGVVYYGRCVRGRFGGGTVATEDFRRGGTISPNAVFMTIVQPRPLFIRATVPEKELHLVQAGVKGTAKPTGYPDLRLTAIVERVAGVPGGSGGFDARITVAPGQQAQALMPGMSCEVKLAAYEKKDVVAVPAGAVAADESDEQKHYVYVVAKDGKPQKREVTVGKRSDKQVEILRGLSEGDEILAEAPKEQK